MKESIKHKNSKYIKFKEAVKELNSSRIDEEEFIEDIKKGKFTTIAKHPVTGRIEKFIVTDIDVDTGKVEGHFVNDFN